MRYNISENKIILYLSIETIFFFVVRREGVEEEKKNLIDIFVLIFNLNIHCTDDYSHFTAAAVVMWLIHDPILCKHSLLSKLNSEYNNTMFVYNAYYFLLGIRTHGFTWLYIKTIFRHTINIFILIVYSESNKRSFKFSISRSYLNRKHKLK